MTTARGFLGSGDLFIDIIKAGVHQGLVGPFLADKFEIKANSELREKLSKGRLSYGQVAASAAIPKPFDLNITLSEADKTGLSIALMGTATTITQAGGTLTAVDFTAKLNVWVPVGKLNLTGTMTLTNSGATVTYVEGTDYLVEREMGYVKAIATIADGATLKLTSTYGAVSGDQIKGATDTAVRAKFVFSGTNLADGTPAVVTVHEAVVASEAAVDFLADQFATVPLKGRMVTPTGYTEPFTIDLRTA